jgi:hypothetical protein
MRRFHIAILVNLLVIGMAAADVKVPTIPKSGQTVADFVPKGWHVLSETHGDVSADGREDVLLALASDAEATASVDAEIPRLFVVLTGTAAGGFSRAAVSSKTLLCKNCGGARGDPFRKPEIQDGVIVIRHEGGSREIWEAIHHFRYKNGTWVLSKSSTQTQDSVTPDSGTITVVNYETGEVTQQAAGPKKGKGPLAVLRKVFTPQAPTGISAFDATTSQELNPYPFSP